MEEKNKSIGAREDINNNGFNKAKEESFHPKVKKVELPMFEGNDPQSFEVQNIKESEKLHLAFSGMERIQAVGSNSGDKKPKTLLGNILQQHC